MIEMDSHANTTVLGNGCLVVHDFYSDVNVTRYDPEDGSKVCQTVTCALAYDRPQNGMPYFLVINQSIHLDNLGHLLRCTMQ